MTQSPEKTIRSGRRARKVLICVVAAFALYTLIGFLILPFALKLILTSKLTSNLNRPVTIESIRINPYSLTFSLKGLRIGNHSGNEVFASLDELFIDLEATSITRKGIVVKEFRLKSPHVTIVRSTDMTYNFADLIPEQKAETTESSEKEKDGKGLAFSINNIQISDGRVEFQDLAKKLTHRITDINTELPFISNMPSDIDSFVEPSFSAIINDTLFRFDGTTKPFSDSLETSFKIKLSKLFIPHYATYSPVKLNFNLTSGYLSTDTTLSYIQYKDKSPSLLLSGIIEAHDIQLRDKKDKKMIELALLRLDLTQAKLFEQKVDIASVLIEKPMINIVRNRGGKINLLALAPDSGQPDPGQPDPGQPKVNDKPQPPATNASIVNISRVTLKDGFVRFSDYTLSPTYSVKLAAISGEIKGFSTTADSTTQIKLSAKIDKHAPLSISGKAKPFAKDLFIDIKCKLSDFELSSVTPYSGKFIGHTISKGKLMLDLSYKIDKMKLQASNVILADQMTLGRRVESEQATKLPVKFALGLMKNRRGEIKIDLPVTGRTDDPEFSVSGIVIKMFIKLVTKAITSPFSLIGAIVGGGGDELSYVELKPGSHTLSPANIKKLDTLASALYERPSLKVEIGGYADIEADRSKIRNDRFINKIKAQRFRKIAKKGGQAALDDLTIEKDEFDKYLWKAYKKENFKKPKNALGMTKKIEAKEMRQLMLSHILVSDDELRELATMRAEVVKDYLLSSGKIDAASIFIVWPEELTPKSKKGIKASRVEFKLK